MLAKASLVPAGTCKAQASRCQVHTPVMYRVPVSQLLLPSLDVCSNAAYDHCKAAHGLMLCGHVHALPVSLPYDKLPLPLVTYDKLPLVT